ncbi:ABC transporter substrate-binding protein [Novosphingobium beihaiensis]|uniref:ABC transporter substrate-binding protein n=1 Tax=Novosphingobium beihaiensis TaxID=2930389 RepID=A0ABT0BM66_9SPHN|nr:ABC transporter substrate-binding protein [Novosphingobium beihaiensis]MCJ2185804.1 ABC transporter substrate-binding protein [Novosphingobium beihaiensis]
MKDRPALSDLTRRQTLAGLSIASMLPLTLSACARADGPDIAPDAPWDEVIAAARGQTVNWAAWAGDPKINAYIAWTGAVLRKRFDIAVRHIKTGDTANTVQTLLADKASGRAAGGRTDLVWINGENFNAARKAGLLWGPFAQRLPHWRLVDTEGKPATVSDFTIPIEGYESPWGMAQLTFFYDSARGTMPPRSVPAMLDWAAAHPGRMAYPAPPDFVGIAFVKQALLELITDRSVLYRPFADAEFAAHTRPLWAFLDALHPHLWRKGRAYPHDYRALRQLLEDREVDIAMSFNPSEAATAVAGGFLPPSSRSYILDGGTIQNCHFVAIPFNAAAKAAAMVTANFLLSPEAQARKADTKVWGDPTVLDPAKLSAEDRARFAALAAPQPIGGGEAKGLLEPHPSWQVKLAEAWRARYAS